jgi:hypothetical protein
VSVLPYAHPQLFNVFKHQIYIYHICEMQLERFYSLNDSVGGNIATLISSRISVNSPKSGGNLCGGNGVSVLPYAHPQLFKVFKHLIYV